MCRRIQNSAEKIQNSAEKILKITNRVIGFWVSESVTWIPCLLFRLTSRRERGASHHPAFMDNCPTISHTFFSFIYPVDAFLLPLRKWGRGVSPRFHPIIFFVWFRLTRSSRFPCVTVVVETFLSDRVAFRTQWNFNNEAPLQRQPTAFKRWLSHRIPNSGERTVRF